MVNTYNRQNPYRKDPDLHFDPVAFNSLIAQHGIRIRIEKTTVCPNYIGNAESMQHDVNCTMCENGYIHYGAVDCWAAFQQNQLVKNFFREGVFDPGSALITIPSHDENGNRIILSMFDRLTLLDQEERFYELLNKSRGDMDLLRYKALSVLHCIDQLGHEYVEGSHFRLTDDGNVVWLPDQPRPEWDTEKGIGRSFSISYLFRPVYRILNLLHEGRYSQKLFGTGRQTTVFPQFALIKKDFYVTKKDVDGVAYKPPVEPQRFNYTVEEEPLDY